MFSHTFGALSQTAAYVLRDGKSADDNKGVDIHQIDLLSGLLAALGIASVVLQAFRTPLKLSYPAFATFLAWLKTNIEADLNITLHSCTELCDTYSYELTQKSLKRRLSRNVNIEDSQSCRGANWVTPEDIKAIIKDGGGDALLELARIGGYTDMKALRRAVYLTKNSPTLLEKVVLWQWIGVVSYWLFLGMIPAIWSRCSRMVKWIVRTLWGLMRKPCPRIARTSSIPPKLIDYSMLELAKHRIRVQHQPWVRFGTYFMLADISNKPTSMSLQGKDDRQYNQDHLDHRLVYDRRITSLISTDQCSSARMMYVISLLSIRAMLLCNNVAFVPSYVILAAHRSLNMKAVGPMLVVDNGTLDGFFNVMYQLDNKGNKDQGTYPEGGCLHDAFNRLSTRMRGKLGGKITDTSKTSLLLNLAFAPIHWAATTAGTNHGPEQPLEPQNAEATNGLHGVISDPESISLLCEHRVTLEQNIKSLLDNLQTFDLHWGATIWLLHLLLTAYAEVRNKTDSNMARTESKSFGQICSRIKVLCYSPFQPEIPYVYADSNNRLLDNITERIVVGGQTTVYKLQQNMPSSTKLEETTFHLALASLWSRKDCNTTGWLPITPPAWCTCAQHCSGLCTLAVERWTMHISAPLYRRIPCVFEIHPPTLSCTNDTPEVFGLFSNSSLHSMPLICSTNIAAMEKFIKKERQGTLTKIGTAENGPSPPGSMDSISRVVVKSQLAHQLYQKGRRTLVVSRGTLFAWNIDNSIGARAAGGAIPEIDSPGLHLRLWDYFCKDERIAIKDSLVAGYDLNSHSAPNTGSSGSNQSRQTNNSPALPRLFMPENTWRQSSPHAPVLTEVTIQP